MKKEDNLSPAVAQVVLDEAIRLLHGGLGKWTEWGDETTDTQETAMRHLVRVGLFEGRRRVSIVDKTGEVLYSCCLRLRGDWDAAYGDVIRQYMPPAYLDETEKKYRPMVRGEGTGFHQVRRTREGELAAADPRWVQQWIGEATKTGTKASVDVEQWQKHCAANETGGSDPAQPPADTPIATSAAGSGSTVDKNDGEEEPRKMPGPREIETYYAWAAGNDYLISKGNQSRPSKKDVFTILKSTDCEIDGVPDGFELHESYDSFLKALNRGGKGLGCFD